MSLICPTSITHLPNQSAKNITDRKTNNSVRPPVPNLKKVPIVGVIMLSRRIGLDSPTLEGST